MPQQTTMLSPRFEATSYRHALTLLLCFVIFAACPACLRAQIAYEPIELATPVVSTMPSPGVFEGGNLAAEANAYQHSPTSNQMLWQQYQALQTGAAPGSEGCQSCGGSGATDYNRCGCNTGLFHWIDGPGSLDNWCVGPIWGVDAGGLFMFRGDADFASVIDDLGGTVPIIQDQFDHGPGGRVFVTGYNDQGWGIQVGYEGINDWNSSLGYELGDFAAGVTRTLLYESQLNSVEINFLRRTESPWTLFSGFRYVQLDEDFVDTNVDQLIIPPPDNPVADPTVFTDNIQSQLLKNRLFGFQLGTRRDAWQFGNRLTVHTFANAGVYCNKFRRDDVDVTTNTVITQDDSLTVDDEFAATSNTTATSVRRDINRIAFVGEAGIAGTLRINHCTALRAGYQILALDGVAQGLDAFRSSLAPIVDDSFNGSTLVFHGLQFGMEYRR